MTEQLYRFYDPETGFYINSEGEPTDRTGAAIYPRRVWEAWGRDNGFELEPIAEDERMRHIGAPMLPGLEAE